MKPAFVLASMVLLLPTPASAQILHQEQVVHNGRAVTLHYELALDTHFQRVGGGPRAATSCRWKSRVLVQRTAVDAQGAPIAALARTIETGRSQEGSRIGHCTAAPQAGKGELTGDPAKLRTLVAEAADDDRAVLLGELASLDLLAGTPSSAN